MHSIVASCALAALLLAVTQADHHIHHVHEDSMSCHVLSPLNADFALALYKKVNHRTGPGKNIFMSPLGLSAALSMLSTGARGKTHAQLFSSLGYTNLDQARVNEAYGHLFQMLGQSQQDQKLDLGNSVAVRTGFNPLQTYLSDLQKYYAGEVFKVDFSNPSEAVAQINRHIAIKTHDKIKEMVKDLDPLMAMVLINYVSHQAVLSVDETGTEAAATTTIEIMPMSLPVDMVLNRPFMVFIIEHSTRSIIFAGKINNPAAA
ncbi:hypothetical protein XENOCAPTIV_022320 [Xenoophorus captivus]|uniref:Serpin domain-containing protein n=1 Tax=Xenoophorus captivus TaxID=1517983 RepID=A0ABV0SB95_9TELE